MLAALLLSIVVVAAACAGAGAGASPAVPTAPSGSVAPSAAPSAAGGPVTTEDQAIAAILAKEPRFKGIGKKDPDMIGQSTWYEVKPASGVGAFVATIYVGWGDCQSGCIDHHTWNYAVAPDGSVNLLNEEGSDPPPEAIPSAGGESFTTRAAFA